MTSIHATKEGNGGLVVVRIFIGPSPGNRVLATSLVVRREEADDLVARIAAGELRRTAMPESMSDERLAEIRAREQAATPGPWRAWDRGVGWLIAVGDLDERGWPSELLPEGTRTDIGRREDAEFIAHARRDVPELLAEVERLREALARNDHSATDAGPAVSGCACGEFGPCPACSAGAVRRSEVGR